MNTIVNDYDKVPWNLITEFLRIILYRINDDMILFDNFFLKVLVYYYSKTYIPTVEVWSNV